jgi:DNA invertase Pin-like site-specific DNA recombinase
MKNYEIAGVFEEKASAAKSRPAFDEMMAMAHKGKLAGSCIVVWSLDRLGRSLVGNMNTILALDQLGVPVVSLREPWLDMQGPVRSLLIAIFSWVGEQERRRIIERTNAGIERARRQGKVLGRPKKYINLDEAVRLRAQGLSLEVVAKKLGVGMATLHRALGRLPKT